MRLLVIAIHGLLAAVLVLWVYFGLLTITASPDFFSGWLSLDRLDRVVTIFYTGVPFLLVVVITYVKAYVSGGTLFFSESLCLLYLGCYISFALMLLMHLGPFVLSVSLVVFHVLMLVFLLKREMN